MSLEGIVRIEELIMHIPLRFFVYMYIELV
jgi:hypothetical protein